MSHILRAAILAAVLGACLAYPAFAQSSDNPAGSAPSATPGTTTQSTTTTITPSGATTTQTTSTTDPASSSAQTQAAASKSGSPLEDKYCGSPKNYDVPYTPIDMEEAWNPPSGEVWLTVHDTNNTLPTNVVAIACFRWSKQGESTESDKGGGYLASPLVRNAPSDTSGARTLVVTVPRLSNAPTDTLTTALGLVPMARMRIILVDPNSKTVLADEILQLGITNAGLGVVLAVIAVLLGLAWLGFVASARKLKGNWLLRIIAADDGHASISQFQLLLWTFVIAGSAIYVMSLSGALLNINDNVLILLGISGAATLGAKLGGSPVAPAAGGAPATPTWSDLVNGSKGEIDPSRVQMLLFTLITAVFVLVYVASTYEVPNIPQGFLILMGISNGVYVGAKVVPAGKTQDNGSGQPNN